MKILFCMEKLDKMEFLALSGVARLLRELEYGGTPWEYRQNFTGGNEAILVITDSMDIAQKLRDNHICCIGYQDREDTEFFQGASAVIFSFEDVDVSYLKMIHHHFYGIPIVIAETEQLVIRESCIEDFDELYRISREAGNDRYMETMSADCELEKEKFQAYISKVYDYFGFGLWTLIEKASARIIGRCGISAVTDEILPEGRSELGYIIGQAYRGKGYGREACRAILEYMVNNWDVNSIYAKIHQDNIPSRKLAEGLGFELLEEKDNIRLYVYSELEKSDWIKP